MKAVLEDAVFRSPRSHIKLLNLFYLALEGIHRIEVDTSQPYYEAWIQRRGPDERTECKNALDWSDRIESNQPSRSVIRVDDISVSEWNVPIPIVTLDDALRLLREPFTVLLEDGETDKRFLLRMATKTQYDFLCHMEQRNGLVFKHGGGLPRMCKHLESDRETKPHLSMRTWILFDNDGIRPDLPSADSRNMKRLCGETIPHHQLERRCIENYLPRPALSSWADADHRFRTDRAAKVDALFRMSARQRYFYNMKKGFKGDRDHDPGDGFYGDVNAEDRKHLEHGFGKSVAKLFADDGGVTESMLREDGAWDEVNGAVTNLIALIR